MRLPLLLVVCAVVTIAGQVFSHQQTLLAATACLLPVIASVVALRSARRAGPDRTLLRWTAVSMALMALGYAVFTLQWAVTGSPPVPSLAEPIYLVCYTTLVVVWLADGRASDRRHRASVLDALLVVVGPAAVVAALVVVPLLGGQPPPLRLLLTSAYPLLDLVLLTAVVRSVLSGRLRGRTAVLWTAAASALLVGDTTFTLLLQAAPLLVTDWYQVPYTVAFACFAAAADRGGPRPAPIGADGSRLHLVFVSVSSCLPATALVVQGASGRPVDWLFLGGGALLTAVLAAVRLHWALTNSQAQASTLDRLARLDELTGLPNRRELTLALQVATESPGAALAVGVLDLDHFKRVNDDGGHAAGDRLLQEATRAWSAELAPGASLYRWGGEEFVVVLRDGAVERAVVALERLRSVVPAPHTVSVGVAVRRPGEGATDLLVRADEQLYRAKAAGRDRLCGDGVHDAADADGVDDTDRSRVVAFHR